MYTQASWRIGIWQGQRSRFKIIETALGMLEGDGDGLVARDVGEDKTNFSTCLGIYL